MTDKPGFKAFEKRIEELIEKTGDMSPALIMTLMKRAEGNPAFDLEKEMERLRTAARSSKEESRAQ